MKITIYHPLAIHELGKRANQEDRIYPMMNEATEHSRLFVLCDGMGGHEHGEVASASVCKSFSEYLQVFLKRSANITDEVLQDALAYAYEELDKLAIDGDTRQMGTTLTLLCFHKDGCTAMHIGDSRIYHLRPSAHTLLYKSRDHSLAYDLYQAGELSYEEIKTFPQKNVITRAMIAGDRNHPKADFVHITDIQPGDYFYICSDGMLEQMDDEELLQLFSSDKSDDEKRDLLIAATVENRDNHSAYIVHVQDMEGENSDANLVNEEPTAKCNAIHIKPDVVEVNHTAEVEVVENPHTDVLAVGTPPPLPEHVIEVMCQKRKTKRTWFIAFIALIIVLAGGMFGYGYFSKQKAEQEKVLDTPRTKADFKQVKSNTTKSSEPKTSPSKDKENEDTIKNDK